MTPTQLLTRIVGPNLATLDRLIGIQYSNEAAINLLAIAGQESACKWRYQKLSSGNPGPARGMWQFERNGGVAGVLSHRRTKVKAGIICDYLSVRNQRSDVWRALEGSDLLAVAFARLLLWSDPMRLPEEQDEGWRCYLRLWRPGKPHPKRWPENWRAAVAAVEADWKPII
jgi:hypothetical protein